MPLSRRSFLATSTVALGTAAVRPSAGSGTEAPEASSSRNASGAACPERGVPRAPAATGVDPWLEIDAAVLASNVRKVSQLVQGRAILAVVKNNAYGLGLATAGPILARLDAVWGFAVVRADEALALRDAGVTKPILLMGPASDVRLRELLARDVRLAAFTDDAPARFARAARGLQKRARVHLYVDTGMHRMGVPYAQALALVESIASHKELAIEGAFTELTEDADYDREQAGRLGALRDAARAKGVSLGKLHAASSDAILHANAPAFLDVVRPGIAIYGGSYAELETMTRGELKPAYRLRARVIRVDQLARGEGVSYHRRWTAERPTWTATLAIGHVDGYPTGAVKGCEVLVGDALYPVVGTVSASHTVIAVGDSPAVRVGDVATLVGPDRPAIHPNEVAKRAVWSDYNMFMHLNAGLARKVVGT